MEENKAVIYAVKTGDKCHYIGKTTKESAEGNVTKSLISSSYSNQGLVRVFENHEDVVIEPVKVVEKRDWYDEKLLEVVQKHAQHHPLVNAQWMLDGKRGPEYWRGKKRDAHTLQRLSESKYKRVVQYDLNGKRIKVWKSGKEVATVVFGDYVVKNGAGSTKLYNVMSSTTLKGRLRYDSYWFREAELLQNFGMVPTKINLDKIRDAEHQRKRESYNRPKTYRRYTVIRYDMNGNEICRYKNIFEAGHALKLAPEFVGRICRGSRTPRNYVLKYGPKELQALEIEKPRYKIKPMNARRPVPKAPEPPKRLPDISFDLWDVDL